MIMNFRKEIRSLKSIREFDQKFTAPSWGFNSLEDYYIKASPILRIQNSIKKLPPILLFIPRMILGFHIKLL